MDIFAPNAYIPPGDYFTSFKMLRGPVLGRGMSGEVVLAISPSNVSVKRAVKILPMLTPDGRIRSIMLYTREVRLIQGLSHPHVVKYVLSARFPESLVICTVYCPNGTIASKLKHITSHSCVEYFLQMTSAVEYLNATKGILHNDIKPTNIFLNAKNHAVLGDFGLSVFIPPDNAIVCAKDMGGTPCYAAPEKLCQEFVDAYKLDVYSLGVLLWCMLFKKLPKSTNVYKCLEDIQMLSSLPQAMRLCLENTLHTDPCKRLSAATLSRSLESSDFDKSYMEHAKLEETTEGECQPSGRGCAHSEDKNTSKSSISIKGALETELSTESSDE